MVREGPAFPITVLFHMYLIISGPNESFVCKISALNVVIHQAKFHLKKNVHRRLFQFCCCNLLFKENAVTYNILVS